jgi:hypothetical protein
VWQADAVDVSTGGMAMRAAVLPAVGEELGVAFKHGDIDGTLRAHTEVVWARDKGSRAGSFGVRFVNLSQSAQRALRGMLDAQDDVMVAEAPTPKLPTPESRVKLFIHGMDAPLRARVRSSAQGEVVVGSDLSFLKLGDKVDIDSAGDKVTGVIDEVDVEVDAKTRVPRLVLTIDIGGRKKTSPGDLAHAPTMLAESPRNAEPELPKTVVPSREQTQPMKAVPAVEARRVAQATTVLGSVDDPVESTAPATTSQHDLSSLDDEMEHTPGWLTQGMRTIRSAYEGAKKNAGPMAERATRAVGELADRVRGRTATTDDDGDVAPTPRKGLRPQHPDGSVDDGDALVSNAGRRNKKVGLYAAVGVVVTAGIVAYASTSGPKVEAPRPQVAVAAEGADTDASTPEGADPNVASSEGADMNAASTENVRPEGMAQPTRQQNPRWVSGRNPRTADLAAAANGPGVQTIEGAAVVVQPMAAQRVARSITAAQPAMNNRAVSFAPPNVRPAAAQPAVVRPAAAPMVAQGPVRPVVFGNPAVRSGSLLRLRMDGPIAAISGVGARGAQIVLSVPGRHSLDVASPLTRIDPRIAGAGVMNRANGAELTLRFREAAPPFVARSRGNMLEIVLAPTPGQPMRAAVRTPVIIGARTQR